MPKKLALIPMKARIAEIRAVYETAAARIVGILSGLDPANFTSVESGRAMQKIKEIILLLNDQVRIWASAAIRAAYDESVDTARTRLELIGAKRLPERKYNPIRHDKKIGQLTKTVMGDYFKANLTIEKTARKYLAVMDQAAAAVVRVEQIQEFDPAEVRGFIDRMVRAALAAKTKYNLGQAHLTSKDIAAKIMAKLRDKIGGGDFITINGRDYNLKSYSELVARTRMREASTEATIEQCKQYDNDLVEIPSHENPCDLCDEYVGNIYSISGETEGYELLPDGGPPWHPNCLCYMNAVSENALAWRNA